MCLGFMEFFVFMKGEGFVLLLKKISKGKSSTSACHNLNCHHCMLGMTSGSGGSCVYDYIHVTIQMVFMLILA